MKKWTALLALILLALPLKAVDQIELFITITNQPVTGDTLVINSTTRTWTNAHSSATIKTNYSAAPVINTSATNLFFNLSAYFLTERPVVQYSATNKLRLVFTPGTAVAASQTGDWAEFTYQTNEITPIYTVRVPITVEANTNRTNIASKLVSALLYSTNRLLGGWESTTNVAFKAENNAFTGTNSFSQGGWNNGSFTNTLALSGIISWLTNGYWTNAILGSPKMTNGANYGLAFSSPGTGSVGSQQFGFQAAASDDYALAVGYVASASDYSALAIGNAAEASATNSAAIGNGAAVTARWGVAVGDSAAVEAEGGIALGRLAGVGSGHTNSVAIGNNIDTTETNQILLGSSSHKVRIPGRIEPTGTITNAIVTGETSLGVTGGPYSFMTLRRYNNTGLANGNNAGVDPNGATYMKVSGPTASFTVNGVANGEDGYLLLIQNSTTYNMTIANDSGVDPTAANRIYTGTGADVTITNNPGCVTLIYDAADSRWVVVNRTN